MTYEQELVQSFLTDLVALFKKHNITKMYSCGCCSGTRFEFYDAMEAIKFESLYWEDGEIQATSYETDMKCVISPNGAVTRKSRWEKNEE